MQLLSSAATAKREAEAKIITAQADVEAAKLMRESSDILDSPAAMQIRQLEVMERLASSQNTKIVFLSPNSDFVDNSKKTILNNDI